MKIIIVSATKFEIQPLLNAMDEVTYTSEHFIQSNFKKHKIDFLIAGVGMVATAFYCAKKINNNYDIALNIGICGSFNKNLELGTVVNIYEDCFSELGAEDGELFLNLEDLKLNGISKIKNKNEFKNNLLNELPKVNGITVNTTHGNESSIEKTVEQFHPTVESMEGAAFMFACEIEKIRYAQIRSVSNYVERRNKNAWNIPLAIKNLNTKLLDIINEFE